MLQEMIRVGAFDRSVLIVSAPTGTGWMDPAAMDPLEYLHGGDTAIVAMQYSYLTSWISLLVEPGYGSAAGRALFRTVYRHWTALPRDNRPKLYLQGLSLGSYGVGAVVPAARGAGGPVPGRGVERAAVPQPDLAGGDAQPRAGHAGVAAAVRRRVGDPLHQPGERARHPRGDVGADAVRLLQYASDPITFFDPGRCGTGRTG